MKGSCLGPDAIKGKNSLLDRKNLMSKLYSEGMWKPADALKWVSKIKGN